MLSNCRNDVNRLKKEMEITSFPCRYHLDVPGPGMNVGFIQDPHIRLQKWAANLYSNQIGIEHDLTNRNRSINNENKVSVSCSKLNRHIQNQPTTIESKTELPPWIFRDKKNNREQYSEINPIYNDHQTTNYTRNEIRISNTL